MGEQGNNDRLSLDNVWCLFLERRRLRHDQKRNMACGNATRRAMMATIVSAEKSIGVNRSDVWSLARLLKVEMKQTIR